MIGCRHKWVMISNETTPSKFEHAMQQVRKSNLDLSRIPWQMCDATRKKIQILQCEQCGKLKRFVTTI